MPASSCSGFRRTATSGPSSVARVLYSVMLLSTLAIGAALLLAFPPPAAAQETESSTESTATPTITLSVNPTSVTESSSSIQVTVTATADEAVSSDVTVSVSVGKTGDSAVEETDYNIVRDFNVTVENGDTSGTGTFNLSGTDDYIPNEASESITVSGTATGYTVDGTSISIADADTVILLSVSPSNVAESSSDIDVTVTAKVGSALSSDVVVTVLVGKVNDLAVAGTDYDSVEEFDMTLKAGETSVSEDFILSGTEDNIAGEGSEIITLVGRNSDSNFLFNQPSIRLTDANDFPSSISLDVDTSSTLLGSQTQVEEDDGAITVTVTVSLPDNSSVLVYDQIMYIRIGKIGDSAVAGSDFISSNFVRTTIESGATKSSTRTFTLSILDDNYANEGNETITLWTSLWQRPSVSRGLVSRWIYTAEATITIKDNDEPPSTINLSATGNGVENKTKSITVSASFPVGSTVLPSSTPVRLSFTGGSATAGVDFKTPTTTVTIGAGQTSGNISFNLEGLEDSIVEGSETISIAGVSTGFSTINGSQITILDNDITLVIDTDASSDGNQDIIYEGNNPVTVKIYAKFPGSSTSTVSSELSITIGKDGDSAVKGNTKDYSVTNPISLSDYKVTIPAGASEGFTNFTFSLYNDTDTVREEPKYATISASISGFVVEDVRLTIRDNDIDLVVTPGSIQEYEDVIEFEVTAKLPYFPAPADGIEIEISVGKSTDTATSGIDYLEVNDFILTIPHMSSVGSKTFNFTIVEDEIDESPELVTVHGKFKDSDTINTSRYTINDDSFEIKDFAQKFPLTLTFLSRSDASDPVVRTNTVTEGSSDTLWLQVGTGGLRQSYRTIPILYRGSATATLDYTIPPNKYSTVPSTSLVITSSLPTTAAVASTMIDDNIAEGSETIFVRSIVDDYYYKSNVVTITDNDTPPTTINLSVNPGMVTESSSPQTITVTASFPSNSAVLPRDVEVAVSVAGNGGTGEADSSDFKKIEEDCSEVEEEGCEEFTVTISKGMTSGSNTFKLEGTDDDKAGEGMETVSVSGTSDGFSVIGTSFKINDGDTAPTAITLTVDTDSMTAGDQNRITEDSGETSVEVTASFPTGSAVLTTQTTMQITVAGGTATIGTADSPNDFTTNKTGNTFNIAINPGARSGSGTFKITVVNDRIYEPPPATSSGETVTITGILAGFIFTNSSVVITDNEVVDLDPDDCNGTYVDSTKTLLVEDCKALIAIRNAWSPNLSDNHPLRTWGNTDNRDIDNWSGITIGSQQVTKLLLPGNSTNGLIGGSLPTTIGNLSKLVEIDLSGNNLSNNISVNIPNQIGQLTALEKLDLSDNNLSGSPPSRWWSSLTKLKTLDLSGNEFSGTIPSRLRSISTLTDLDLSDNKFFGSIPGSLDRLTALKTLDISNNEITGTIPRRLGNLAGSGLTKFSFCGNNLTGSLPTAFRTGVDTPGIASSDYNNIAVCRRSTSS